MMIDFKVLYVMYSNAMCDPQWRHDNRLDLYLWIEDNQSDPRGQCSPIYRSLKETEFYDRILSDIDFKNKIFSLFYN